ncbi:3-hydroxyacyl-CoA dehydrogenase NAD-binding domain-containing protein [Marinobacter sp.]|uniref:3-hydroxyacyl-CoA dehydrogenase NAD-binding domain-containing protein n=1 Tax=Marinobacter sp. TaxID=50741 RepID=UPI001B6FD127|nr:3-hydroxyacyl-CoA dehydrogenase NAD-binding domain-containing protein [Marinobacter sp.]MBQ0832810.1 enoyl-CoA hydratase/isomerase family protein [Marinobacter sp.]
MTGHILKALSAREMALGPFSTNEQSSNQASHGNNWKHWRLGRDNNDVAWLLFDKHGASANVLSAEVLEELDSIVGDLENNPPKALALRSIKSSGFCMGADISEFKELQSEEEAVKKLSRAHEVVDRFEALPFTKIAVIHGACLGGGLELALCCDHRLAIAGAKLGFPEVQLGLHPGLGGTDRLTHLIDPIEAMTMMLTGKNTHDSKAKKLGLVDDVIQERHVEAAIRAAAQGDLKHNGNGLRERLLSTRPARQIQARQMRAKTFSKAPPEHYPAPKALIDLWETHGGHGKAMRKAELKSFAQLLNTDASRNLVRVFFLREKMKGITRADVEPIRHVHVIGAGEMGGDIAGWCAFQGLKVTLFDMEPKKIAQAVAKLSKLCEKKHRSRSETRDILDNMIPDFQNHGVSQADLVIEAVPEKKDIKHKVYSEAEPKLKENAILATNTSSIPLESLQEGLQNPERLVGLHFFNPVASMPLVEVVTHDAISETTYNRARAFVGQINRLPAPVATAPGFLVNRALTPYLVEAITMLDEGIQAETIDKLAEDFGMPMGPIELADQVGLDICISVSDMLRERLDTNMPDSPKWLTDLVEEGKLGKKSGEGLYQWKDGKAVKKDETTSAPDDALDRLLLPMLNACMACIREKVVADEDMADGAMVFGTGFAPFRGGPMKYAHDRGFDNIRQQLASLADRYGQRFQPDAGWPVRP